MKSSTAFVDSSRKRTKIASLRVQERLAVETRAVDQDELQQQERADVADVLDRHREPLGECLPSLRRRAEDRPVRAAHAALRAGRLDQPALLEQLERAVDERPPERPDPPDLAVARHLARQRPAVAGLLGEESQHRPFAGGELALEHHPLERSRPRPAVWVGLD